MSFTRVILVVALLACTASHVLASPAPVPGPARATYYLSTTGDDANDGLTQSTPKRSLAVIANLLAPGVTVLLHRGDVWAEPGLSLYIRDVDGTQEAPARVGAYGDPPAPRPRIRIDVYASGTLFDIRDSRFLVVEDLELEGGPSWKAATVDASDANIRFVRVAVSQLPSRR